MGVTFWVAAVSFGLRIHADGLFLSQLRSGDAEALRPLVQRHHAALVGLAQTIVKNRSTAGDVTQETWLAFVANISKFEGKAALSTWFIAILLKNPVAAIAPPVTIAAAGKIRNAMEETHAVALASGMAARFCGVSIVPGSILLQIGA